VSEALDGDLIRPLGLVALYFAYAEYEVDLLLAALSGGTLSVTPNNSPLGQKLATLREALSRLALPEADELICLIDNARPLIDLRNVLMHSCILATGRVLPSDKTRGEQTVTPEQLTELAEGIFTWKERLSAGRQLRLMRALERTTHGGT